MLSLTRNSILNYLAHLQVKLRHKEIREKTEKWYDDPNDNNHEELIQQIIQRIDNLPERCGEVMRLCFIECKKYKEIAEILNLSVNTVKTHISKGLKILREEFPASLLMIYLFRFPQ